MTVSVLTPVRDGAAYLAEALASARAQTHRDVELVVVDDGSTDDSAAIAESFGAVVVRQAHAGYGAALVTALAHASGDVVAFLDGDDRWPPDKLERQLAALERSPGAGWVTGLARVFVDPGADAPPWLPPAWSEPIPAPTTAVVRRSVLDEIGGFAAGFGGGADWEWIVRARDAGFVELHLPEVVLEYRVHAGNESADTDQLRSLVFRTIRESLARRRAAGAV